MRPRSLPAFLLAGALLAPSLLAQVANDECSGAPTIGVGTTAGSTVGATQSPITGSCASFGAPLGADVWYRFVPPEGGLLTVSLVGDGGSASFDTVLSVFEGPCGDPVELACNDDALGTLQSRVALAVSAGVEYFIELGGWGGASGAFVMALSLEPATVPVNDKCNGALPIGEEPISGNTFLATTAPTTPQCAFGGAPVGNDVWFVYTAPADGFARASLVNDGGFADFDTVLGVFTGVCGQLVPYACNDDAGPFLLASEVVFPVTAGTDYRIEIGGWNGATGQFTLAMTFGMAPANDECFTALPVSPGAIVGTTLFATASPVSASCAFEGGEIGADVWFRITAPETGLLRASTSPDGGGAAEFDTVLAVFGGDCEELVELACNDDTLVWLQSELAVSVTAGETYFIVLAGFGGASGGFLLDLSLTVQEPGPDVVLWHAKISETAGGFTGDLSQGFASFGLSVAALGDVDGDGVGDLAVGSPFEDFFSADAGAVWILFLDADGTVKSHRRLASGAGGLGFATGQTQFGISVAPLGDLDGDGVPDVAVGADLDDDGGPDHGSVRVLFLAADGSVRSHVKISDTQGGFGGTLKDGCGFGRSLARLGDLDGDGLDEIVVGAPFTEDGGEERGAVWVLFLEPDGTVKDWQRISDLGGGFTGTLADFDQFGMGIAGVGDVDGDGLPDLAVGAPGDDTGGSDHGAVWVLFLQADGRVDSWTKLADGTGGFEGLLFDIERFGTGLASLADGDGDGVRELAVGAIGDPDGGPHHGAVWLLRLDAQGEVKSHAKISSSHGGFGGALGDGAFFGEGLADLGDFDGDGLADLAVGNRFDDDGASDRGAIWLLFLDACNPWIDVGEALPGAMGPPQLDGSGTLQGDTLVTLTLRGAKPFAPATLVVGSSALNAPLLGGTLVPLPELLDASLQTGAHGAFEIEGRWPVGVPSGMELWFQVWVLDGAAPQGVAASNGLIARAP